MDLRSSDNSGVLRSGLSSFLSADSVSFLSSDWLLSFEDRRSMVLPIFFLIANTGESLDFCSLATLSEIVSIDPFSDCRLSLSFLSLELPLPKVQETRLPSELVPSTSPDGFCLRSVVGDLLKRWDSLLMKLGSLSASGRSCIDLDLSSSPRAAGTRNSSGTPTGLGRYISSSRDAWAAAKSFSSDQDLVNIFRPRVKEDPRLFLNLASNTSSESMLLIKLTFSVLVVVGGSLTFENAGGCAASSSSLATFGSALVAIGGLGFSSENLTSWLDGAGETFSTWGPSEVPTRRVCIISA